MDVLRGSSSYSLFQGLIGILNVGFVEGGKPADPEINRQSKEENQLQIQPTCDTRSGNRTWATVNRSERDLLHTCY